jgi:MFS family permease
VLTAAEARAQGLSRPFYVVTLLAIVLGINYIDRGALPTAGPLIKHDLGLSQSEFGILSSAFFYMYAPIQIPVGWLAERLGAHIVLAAGIIIWALATMLMGFAAGFWSIFALRLLLGLGESAGFPCVSKLLACVVPLESLGKANGLVGLGYLMAPGIGIWLAGLLIDGVGWRGTFVVFGIASLFWLIPWARVKLPKLATARADASTPTWGMVLSQRGLWGTSLGLFSSNYLWYFMLSWLPSYLVEAHGFSMHQMERVGTAGYIVNGASAMLTGWLIDRHVRGGGSPNFSWKLIMALAHSGSVVFMLMMAWGSEQTAMLGMFGFQLMMGASSAGVYVMGQILAGPKASGRWVGVQNSIGNFSGMISPAFTGFIIQRTGHYELAFVAASVVSLLGIIGWIGLVPKLVPIHWSAPTAGARQPTLSTPS